MDLDRFVVGDAAWEKVAPLLPGKASDSGVTAKNNRLFLEAVLWRAGARPPPCAPPRALFRRACGCRPFAPGLLARGWGRAPARHSPASRNSRLSLAVTPLSAALPGSSGATRSQAASPTTNRSRSIQPRLRRSGA